MKTFTEWREATYPNWKPRDRDEMLIQWLDLTVHELIATLQQPAPPPVAAPTVFPDAPKRCMCGNFEEDFEGDTFTCVHCGGLRF